MRESSNRSESRSRAWRTTPFRLAVRFGAAYVVGVALLLGLVYVQTAGYLARRVDRILAAQAEAFRQSGPEDVLARLAQEDRRDPLNDFALYRATGQKVAGDLALSPRSSRGQGR